MGESEWNEEKNLNKSAIENGFYDIEMRSEISHSFYPPDEQLRNC